MTLQVNHLLRLSGSRMEDSLAWSIALGFLFIIKQVADGGSYSDFYRTLHTLRRLASVFEFQYIEISNSIKPLL